MAHSLPTSLKSAPFFLVIIPTDLDRYYPPRDCTERHGTWWIYGKILTITRSPTSPWLWQTFVHNRSRVSLETSFEFASWKQTNIMQVRPCYDKRDLVCATKGALNYYDLLGFVGRFRHDSVQRCWVNALEVVKQLRVPQIMLILSPSVVPPGRFSS